MENVTITFTEDEAHQVVQPHSDALVVSLRIANNQVHHILIDNKSPADVLFKGALDQMDLGGAVLQPVRTPLDDFSKDLVETEGMITLSVTMDEAPYQVTRMISFLDVNRPSIYNTIVGRPTLYSTKV